MTHSNALSLLYVVLEPIPRSDHQRNGKGRRITRPWPPVAHQDERGARPPKRRASFCAFIGTACTGTRQMNTCMAMAVLREPEKKKTPGSPGLAYPLPAYWTAVSMSFFSTSSSSIGTLFQYARSSRMTFAMIHLRRWQKVPPRPACGESRAVLEMG